MDETTETGPDQKTQVGATMKTAEKVEKGRRRTRGAVPEAGRNREGEKGTEHRGSEVGEVITKIVMSNGHRGSR